LELSLHRGKGDLLLYHRGLRIVQGGVRLLLLAIRRRQRLVSLQERGIHPVDRGGALRGQGTLVQKGVLHGP
jgi:hypothetical protein